MEINWKRAAVFEKDEIDVVVAFRLSMTRGGVIDITSMQDSHLQFIPSKAVDGVLRVDIYNSRVDWIRDLVQQETVLFPMPDDDATVEGFLTAVTPIQSVGSPHEFTRITMQVTRINS